MPLDNGRWLYHFARTSNAELTTVSSKVLIMPGQCTRATACLSSAHGCSSPKMVAEQLFLACLGDVSSTVFGRRTGSRRWRMSTVTDT